MAERLMKDSGVEWIGQIPYSWNKKKMLYCLRKPLTDGPHETPKLEDEGIPFISIDSLNDSKDIDFSVCKKFISEELYTIYKRKAALEEGDILFSKAATIGKTAIVGSGKFMIWSPLAIIKNDKKEVDNSYLYYLLNCDQLIKYASLQGSYSTQINVGMRELERVPIPVPSIEEQKKIADFLDSKCSETDSLTKDIESQIETLEQYKKSVITETVTKGLNPGAETKDSGIDWVLQIPEAWSVMPNKYIMEKVKDICPIYKGEDIISLSMDGVKVRDLDAGGKMPKTFDGYQRIKPGNLLMCLFDYDVTPRCIGLINDEGLTSPAYSQFKMKNSNHAPYYYYYYLMIDNTKEILHLAKNLRHSFTEEQLGMIDAPVPPVDEQKKIADYLDIRCSEIDSIVSDKKKQLETLAEYKKSLIYEYVTGKKEVPND